MKAKPVCLYAIRWNQRPNDLFHHEGRVSLASQPRTAPFTERGARPARGPFRFRRATGKSCLEHISGTHQTLRGEKVHL